MKLSVLLLLVAPPLIYGAIFFGLSPSINNDVGVGLSVLQSMRGGAPFNVLVHPDSADIAKDASTFVAAWSPSQYLLPALFQFPGFDLGQSITVVVALCVCLGIIGWYLLYRTMGFSKCESLLSCLLIEAFRHFLAPFDDYNGGEVILFGAAPWSGLLIWRSMAAGAAGSFIATLAALTLATFAKLSGLIFVSALLAGAAFYQGRAYMRGAATWTDRTRAIRSFARAMMPMALAWLVFAAIFRVFWLSRGMTAIDPAGPAPFSALNFYFPFVATVLSAFGFGDALGFLRSFPPPWGKPFDNEMVIYALTLPFCAVALSFVAWRLRASLDGTVGFVLATCAAYVACLVVLYSIGANLVFGERFFRPASLLLLPCLVSAQLAISVRPLRYLAWSFTLSLACFGIAGSIWHIAGTDRRPVGTLGFRHPVASSELVAYLQTTFGTVSDRRNGRVVYVPSPDIALEIRDARVIATTAYYEPVAWLKSRKYFGRVEELVIVMPTIFLAQGRADAILQSFKDYAPDRWARRQIDSRFIEFRQ